MTTLAITIECNVITCGDCRLRDAGRCILFSKPLVDGNLRLPECKRAEVEEAG